MKERHRTLKTAMATLGVAFSAIALSGQTAIPTQGGRGGQGQPGQGQGRRGGGPPEASNLPASPVAAPLPTISAEVTGPGKIFESLMELKAGDDMAHFKYEAKEYFVSGTANGQPYKTRIVIRRPADSGRFSGLVLAESMHPSGNAWMFHFTHRYSMTSGHIGLDILTSTHVPFVEFNPERYKDLQVGQGQASEIIAQVGALIKSKQSGNPLAGLPLRKMILAGTSASAGVLVNYLPAHMVLRLPDMKPIYDGFMPTSNGATIRQIDVPMIQVPTMTRSDGRQRDRAAGRRRAGQSVQGLRVRRHGAHRFARRRGLLPGPVQAADQPIPDGGVHVGRAESSLAVGRQGHRAAARGPHLVDRNVANDGSLMALDEFGNAKGGIRNPYVDVPTKKIGVRNEGAVPPINNAAPVRRRARRSGAESAVRPGGLRDRVDARRS